MCSTCMLKAPVGLIETSEYSAVAPVGISIERYPNPLMSIGPVHVLNQLLIIH